MKLDRFAFARNLQTATHYSRWNSAFWPPAADYHVISLDIASKVPFSLRQSPEFCMLDRLIDSEWHACKSEDVNQQSPMRKAGLIAESLRRIAGLLPTADDRRALNLRAVAVQNGYDDGILSELVAINEDITFVAGRLSTWYGKQEGGLPTAFGCFRDTDRTLAVAQTMERISDAAIYMRSLHSQLRVGEIPAFSAAQLFFMAGEGNRHPKHIAYFLPEDEGVKQSRFNKTYYFVNTHRALIDAISLPLARRLLDIGTQVPIDATQMEPIPTLGVLAHEIGHAVRREGLSFCGLNASDLWASSVLQEVAADVFALLVIAEVLAPLFQITSSDAVFYHLAECLRYVDRGLGYFPDSDGMYLQLNYLATFGALTVDPAERRLLAGDPEVIIAGFRSLARVLADTLLASDVRRSLSLYRSYGPATCNQLTPLIEILRGGSLKTIEYVQQSIGADGQEASDQQVKQEEMVP